MQTAHIPAAVTAGAVATVPSTLATAEPPAADGVQVQVSVSLAGEVLLHQREGALQHQVMQGLGPAVLQWPRHPAYWLGLSVHW